MTKDEQIELVRRYFSAVDAQKLDGVLATLRPDCVFTVETHGVRLQGRDEIARMFDRLWSGHKAVRHHQFVYVPDPAAGRIATQFQVINTEQDGQLTYKSNCNFFEIHEGRFATVAVYMAGANTLDLAGPGRADGTGDS